MPSRFRPVSERLRTRISQNGGVFSRQDALACGHHDQDLRAWVRSAVVVQATRGGYYRPPETEQQWSEATPLERDVEHERRRIAAVLYVLPDTFVASHQSALLVHRLPRLHPPDRRAEVCVMATRAMHPLRRAGVHMSRPIPGTQLAIEAAAVSVVDAIAQTACTQGQLAGLIPADAAAHENRLDLADLEAACQRMAGRRGAAGLHGLTALVDGRCESPGETRLFTVLRDARIAVTPQVWIDDEHGRFARVDFLVDGTNVVIEFDGLGKYDDPDAARDEKKREHRLHRAGYVVVRVIWADFADIAALVRRIKADIARAR